MKKIIIGIIAFMMALSINISNAQSSQDRKADRQRERWEKKQEKELQKLETQEKVTQLIKDQSFVLEADALYDRYRNRYNVTANNFIMIEGDRVVLQTSFPYGVGYNGLGGITINGKLIDYQVSGGDEKSITISAQVSSTVLGHGVLTMNIGSSGFADATFSDNWGNRISFSGQIQSLEDSYLFEGMSI